MRKLIFSSILFFAFTTLSAQSNSDLGAWYMYFGGVKFENSQWGIHGEAQYRNHNLIGDLEQLLLRTGLQYHLKDGSATFTLGYGNITTENEGTPDNTFYEHRIYQEALIRQDIYLVNLNHRFRYEQRFIDEQDLRTRFRYAIFINIPLTNKRMAQGGWYIPIYNEVFLNVETSEIVEHFDRNRLYGGLGYVWANNLKVQLGVMEQTTNNWSKTQLQFSLHHVIRAGK